MVGRGGPSDIVAAPAMAAAVARAERLSGRTRRGLPGAGVHRFTSAGCADGTEVAFVQIDGGGHTWLGGAFDASQQRAVLRHPRQVSASR